MRKIGIRQSIRTIRRCLKIADTADRGNTFRSFAVNLCSVAQEYLHVIIVTGIIDRVNGLKPWREIISFVMLTGLLECALFLAMATINRRSSSHNFAYNTNKRKMLWEKIMNMDYVHMESPDTYVDYERAQQGMNRMDRLVGDCLNSVFRGMVMLLAGIVMILPLAFRKAPGMGGFVGFVQSPWGLVAVIALVTVLELLISLVFSKKVYRLYAEIDNDRQHIQYGRIAGYYENDICHNYQNGKEIRIYHEQELVCGEYERNVGDWIHGWASMTRKVMGYNVCNLALLLASYLLMYGFAMVRAVTGMLTVGELIAFVMYFSRIRSGIQGISGGLGNMQVDLEFMGTAFDFLELPDQKYRGTIPTEKRDDNQYEFAFRHVWFKYPNSEQYVLRDVNLTWRIGEKMALVGKNGCGKSTLVKLLCRLYDPTEGEITLNGIDIKKYKYEDYMALFSVVFQDSGLFSFGLAENIAADEDYDADRVRDCIVRAGMGEWLDRAEKGMETCLYKDFDERGVEISGGEAQKLCLARAIYKGAPFIVLDEPTASLDPISEHEVYTRFNSIVGTRTAVYISHRLSSCRFCDEIVVMEEGSIAERGSHEALLERGGVYKTLWAAQAEYYKDTAGELYAG